eukprot:scaffold294445_cov37-Tisochrysis_lutea.AAC.2
MPTARACKLGTESNRGRAIQAQMALPTWKEAFDGIAYPTGGEIQHATSELGGVSRARAVETFMPSEM